MPFYNPQVMSLQQSTMTEVANVCVTPIRTSQGVLRERQLISDTRRSLFEGGDSDLSDISPLSRTSSELLSPEQNSPIKIIAPFKLRGVALLSPDHGIIKPSTFYGGSRSACASLDGAEMYRQIRKSLTENSKARTSLFLDDLPKNKKRSRSSGNPNESTKQLKKKIKLQPNLRHDVRKPSKSEIRHREILRKKKAMKQLKEKKQKEKTNQEKRKYNWEIFNTTEDLQRLTWKSSVILTPPRSSKKKKLISHNFICLSPNKLNNDEHKDNEERDTKADKTNIHDELVKEIREGVLDMMKDDEDDEVSQEVNVLLEKLDKGDEDKNKLKEEEKYTETFNLVANAENIDPGTPPSEQFFPVFSNTPKSSSSPLPKLGFLSQKKKFGIGMDQLQLDVGQNNLREIECSGCGLMYVNGNPEDMKEHEIFHYKFKELHFNGWKNERVVRYEGSDRVICVRNTDNKLWWKKATNVLEIIDSELGYPTHGPRPTQIYMFVVGKFIRGVVAVSPTTRAYKMLHIEGNDDIGLCSEEEYPVKCLISRIWVDRHFRRCNIGTTLLDSVRSNYTFGYILKCSDLAFSSPTEDGRRFIETYTKTKEYFVYT